MGASYSQKNISSLADLSFIRADAGDFTKIWRRFWAKIEDYSDTDACWDWTKTLDKDGYGAFRLGHSNIKSHRASWLLHKGDITEGLFVLHKCDNPKCVNPSHLWLGTHEDNMKDKIAKGRAYVNKGVHWSKDPAHAEVIISMKENMSKNQWMKKPENEDKKWEVVQKTLLKGWKRDINGWNTNELINPEPTN